MAVSKKTRQIDETSGEFSLALSRLGDGGRMTDLERARAYLASIVGHENPEEHAAAWFAAARREGAEEAAEEWRGKLAEQCGKTLAAAAEMRERAAEACDKAKRQMMAYAIRAIPLMPEA